jgi:nucleoside-diphosphate-sugar epimerase
VDSGVKKILITGGLGYIGTELCKLYSGISWKYNIAVLDKNFYSARVEQLRKWNIKFYNFDLISINENIKNLINSADVIHHLAGITNVAYTKDEEFRDPNRSKEIQQVAIEGTRNIINFSKKDCRIIFPSTHVVYDGLDVPKQDILEDEEPCPQLTYSKSKYQNEIDLRNSDKDFIILRLGSVYGYSGDATRINIMPNLFSKISSTTKEIKLFSGGEQLKSLVPLIDVVRCFKFFEENNDFTRQIYNVVKDKISVKRVAEICKKISPEVKIISTDDPTPNAGYTLSNQKLLNTGFKFLYHLENNLKEMIENWSKVALEPSIEFTKLGEKELIDERGKISNYELTEPINLIGYIESKKNTVRANHYHPIQEQKCLIIKGQYISVLRDLLDKEAPLVTQLINEGDLVVTRANVAHTMIFTKDTVFLNLVRGEREHKNYGITHTIKKIIVDENLKEKLLLGYRIDCRCCGNIKLKRVISLGFQPLANNLLNSQEENFETYPLELNYCEVCFNCQLSYVVDPNIMFKKYLYVSSTAETFKNHFKDAAFKYIKKFNLSKEESFIIDIGSNDGIALLPFKELHYKKLLGIEPAINLAEIAIKKGINTICKFFDSSIQEDIKEKAKLILASNVFAHSDKIDEITRTMKNLLEDNGVIIIEIQYLMNTLKDLTFDNIYHEHVNYWCLHSLKYFFDKHKMKIFDAEKIDTHGGSLRIYVSKDLNIKEEKTIRIILDEEIIGGIDNYKVFQEFEKKIIGIRKKINNNFNNLKKSGKQIIGYGSPAKASTAINFFGLGKYFNFILEDSPLKFNKFLPTGFMSSIKIIEKKKYEKNLNDKIVVLAWNYIDYIKKNNVLIADQIVSIKDLEK